MALRSNPRNTTLHVISIPTLRSCRSSAFRPALRISLTSFAVASANLGFNQIRGGVVQSWMCCDQIWAGFDRILVRFSRMCHVFDHSWAISTKGGACLTNVGVCSVRFGHTRPIWCVFDQTCGKFEGLWARLGHMRAGSTNFGARSTKLARARRMWTVPPYLWAISRSVGMEST